MSKYFLLSASVIALLSSQTFASRQVAINLADQESNEQAIITKLTASNDYTFSLDEEEASERIKDATLALQGNIDGEQDAQQIADLKFEAKHKIRTNLDYLKTHPVDIGHGYTTTENFNGVLSTTSHRNPLAYPVFLDRGHRDKNDAFLPTTYKSNFLSKALCDEIRTYAYSNGLSEDDAKKLNKYVQPIFYITQLEVMKILEGNQNLASTKRWVYGMGYDDIVKSIQSQTEHHHTLIKRAHIAGLDPSIVETSLVPRLIDLSFALMSNPKRELYITDNGHKYLLGKNKKGFLSLIHPSNGLPYPIFKDQRPNGDMNLPEEYQAESLLTTQWQRVGTYFDSQDIFRPAQKQRLKLILEPVAYLAHKHLKTLQIDLSPELLTETLQQFMDQRLNPQHQNEPYSNVLYRHIFPDQDLRDGLEDLRSKVETHHYLVSDLYPEGLQERDREFIHTDLLQYLLVNEMIDRVRDRLQNQLGEFVERLREF